VNVGGDALLDVAETLLPCRLIELGKVGAHVSTELREDTVNRE